jgi:diguanylate cyclase (GGDEF)-like protein/PAS domain S-box-containing protein
MKIATLRSLFATQARRQWLLLLLILTSLAGYAGFLRFLDHETIARNEAARLQTQVRIADQLLTAQVRSADAALRAVIESVNQWRSPDGYLPFAHDHLQRIANMMPGIQTFAVLDAKGVCQLSNNPGLLGQDLSDRSFFRDAVTKPEKSPLYVTPPYKTVLGAQAMTVSRAIIGPQGKFEGVVIATLSPDYFETLMKNLSYSPDMRVGLVHDQGQMYVSAPHNEELLKLDFSKGTGFFNQHLGSGRLESEFEGISVDKLHRMVHMRTVAMDELRAQHGFVAIASRETTHVFKQWRKDAQDQLVLFGLISAIACISLAVYQQTSRSFHRKALAAEQAMLASNQRFEHVANTIPCVLFDLEAKGPQEVQILYVGPYCQKLLGLTPQALIDRPHSLIERIHRKDQQHVADIHAQAFANRMNYECEFRYFVSATDQRWLKVSASTSPDADDKHALWSGFMYDITDSKHRIDTLHELAYHDPLTGAENRRAFMEKLEAEFHRTQRTGNPAAVIMLDIDHFKRVNDTHGHDVGDLVLKHLVSVLQGGLRRIDTLGRIGGEEFAVLLPETTWVAAAELAERLRVLVESQAAAVPGTQVSYTISLGLATIAPTAESASAVLKQADKAMYQAKHSGRNRVCVAEDDACAQSPGAVLATQPVSQT